MILRPQHRKEFLLNSGQGAGGGGGGGPTGDPYWAQVGALLHYDTSPTLDAKGNTWTAAGSAAVSSTQSMFGGSSLYLNGTNQYVTTSSNTLYDLGLTSVTTAATWEAFIRWDVVNSSQRCIFMHAMPGSGSTARGGWEIYEQSGRLYVSVSQNYTVPNTTAGWFCRWQLDVAHAVSASTWYHVAVVFVGGQIKIFINGVEKSGTWMTGTNFGSNTIGMLTTRTDLPGRIGASGATDANNPSIYGFFPGYIEEHRWTPTVARYGSTFTPPAAPFPEFGTTPWTWDAMNKGSTITLSSNDSIATASNAGSVLGTGRKNSGKWQFEVTVTNSSNAVIGLAHPAMRIEGSYPGNTIESNGTGYYSTGRVYGHQTNAAYGATYANGDVIGVVIDFTALTIVFYKNGVSQGTSPYFIPPTEVFPCFGCGGASASAVSINPGLVYPVAGASAWDNIDQPMVTASCVMLLNCDSASGSTTFTDSQGHAQVSFVLGVAADTTIFKNGTASMNCTGGRIYFADSVDWTLGKGDWTITSWVRGNATAVGGRTWFCGQSSNSGGGGSVSVGKNTSNAFQNSLVTTLGNTTAVSAASYTVLNTWHRVVGQRWGNSILISVDGVFAGRGEIANWGGSTSFDSVSMWAVGGVGEYASAGYGGTYGERWPGWIDDFKFVKGRALYRDRGFIDPFGADDASVTRWESFDDDFSTDPTVAGKYTQLADTPQTWTWASGRFNVPATVVNSTMHPGTGKFANCKVRAIVNSAAGLVLRQTDVNNYYHATFNDSSVSGSANTMNVFIRSGGTFSGIATAIAIPTWTAGTDALIEFEVIGSQLRAWFNGTLCGTWTNTTLSAAGFVGMRATGIAASFNSFGVTVY